MKSPRFACLLAILISTLVLAQSNPLPPYQPMMPKSPEASGLSQHDSAAHGKIVESYGKLPLAFEENQGQTDAKVKFLSRGSGYTLFLTGDEAVFSFRGSEAKGNTSPVGDQFRPQAVTPKTRAVLRMKLRNANAVAKVTGTDEQPGKSNYFVGNDPKKWHRNVSTYAKVKYEEIYSGIDLVYYGNQRQLEYDFVVAPGADPRRIQFDVRGAKRISRDKNGDLVLQTGAGEVRWVKPVVYQEKNGARQEIAARYVIQHKRVGFEVAYYDFQRPLFIDPLIYSSYLGGSSDDYGYSIALGNSGDAYVTGYTNSIDFPTMNHLQGTCGSCATLPDAFVTKLNPAGSALVYSTYLGGSSDDYGNGIALDSAGNAYVTGYTSSTDFPTMNAMQPANGGGYDAFVTEINPTGSALVYSTYLGGSNDDRGSGIAVDSDDNADVTGSTISTDFPTMNPLQLSNGGGNGDAFVTKLNPAGSALVYSTYLGGSNVDNGNGIAVDSAGNTYITGFTISTDFPTTPEAFQTMCKGGCVTSGDAFVTEINPAGSALVYSTYLGGGNDDDGTGIAADSAGNAYVTGRTQSIKFPVTPGAFQTICNLGHKGCEVAGDAFVTKLNPTGSVLVYSTYLGGSSTEHGNSIAVDGSGNAYVTSITLSTDFPTMNPLQPANGGHIDAFVTKLDPAGSALVYSTYLGGSGDDYGYSIAVDNSGNAYVTGYTNSIDFTTMNPLQPANGGGYDALVTKISTQPSAVVTLVPPSLNFGDQPVGIKSAAQTSTLTNTGDDTLTITSIQVAGTNSRDFAQHNNCRTSVPPFGSCQITVTFTPSVLGDEGASVSITDNAPGSPQSLFLTGVGTPPIVKLSPPSLTFGPQPVGTTSLPQTVTLSASGALSITLITTSAEFGQTNNCGSGIPAGGSCQVNVTFSPTAPGLQNGTLMITDSGAGSPQSVPLSGTGTQPAVTLSPTSLNFGNQTVNITSSPQVSTLKNSGNGTLTITSIGVIGSNLSDFSETNNCGTALHAGGSCKITVRFKPSNTGTETASVRITDDAPDSPQSLPLSGVGVLPAVTFSPTSLTFATQVVFTTSPAQKVTLTNTGLGILKITVGGLSGQFGGSTNCTPSIAAGASCTINVTFKPKAKGALIGAISVTDNALGSPQKVPLSGTGTYVQLSPISVNFGNQPVNTTSLPKYITLTNKGSATVNFTGTGITITGTSSGDFAETNNCDSSVASGASCKIKVTFTPSQQGKRTADVSISDDGGGSPQLVPLTGTGTL